MKEFSQACLDDFIERQAEYYKTNPEGADELAKIYIKVMSKDPQEYKEYMEKYNKLKRGE